MRMRKLSNLLLFVAGSLIASTASAAITDGLVGYWSFDQDFTATLVGDGFTADDLLGFPEGADPIMGGPTIDSTAGNWQFGGGGGRFIRAEEDRVSIFPLEKNLLEASSAYSYSAWYRLENNILGSDRHFVLETGGATFPVSYGTRFHEGEQKGQVFSDTPSSDPNFFVDNGVTKGAVTGQWHHIVVTYDPQAFDVGGTFFGEIRAYLDGQPAGTSDPVAGAALASPGLVIGGHRAGSGRNFDGWIDEVALWNRVLTTAEIAFLHENPVDADPSVPGDFDGDGDVDGADFVVWQTNFPKSEGGTLDTGDADGDGDVDGADFVVWQTNFPFTSSPAASTVPEPNAVLLLALGGVMVALGRQWNSLTALHRACPGGSTTDS